MIICSRCNKIYDYEKYNGICPVCARYNRPAGLGGEQELHGKYDTYDPHTMNSDRMAHRRNGDRHRNGDDRTTRVNLAEETARSHGSANRKAVYERNGEKVHRRKTSAGESGTTARSAVASAARTVSSSTTRSAAASRAERDAARRKGKGLILIPILLMACSIVFSLGEELLDRNSGNVWDVIDNDTTIGADDSDIGFWEDDQDTVYVEYVYEYFLGQDMSETAWEDYSVTVSQEEAEELAGMTVAEGYAFHLFSVEVDTQEGASVNLEDCAMSFCVTETGEELEILKCFDKDRTMLSGGEFGYMDYLVAVPLTEEGDLTVTLRYDLYDSSNYASYAGEYDFETWSFE